MYYLLDYDTLDILFQHTKEAALKKYVKANNLALATEIISKPEDLDDCLTKPELAILYDTISMEKPPNVEPDMLADFVFEYMGGEVFPELPKHKAAPKITDNPEPKPAPKTTKPATGNKVSVISTKALQDSIIDIGSVPPVKRIHKQICEVLNDNPIPYTKLMDDLVFELDKTEKLLKGYVTDGIRKDILTMENPDEL